MFTGIIEEIGHVNNVKKRNGVSNSYNTGRKSP